MIVFDKEPDVKFEEVLRAGILWSWFILGDGITSC